MNPRSIQNYVGETWFVDGKRGEAMGATVDGKIIILFDDGTTRLCNPEELLNEQGQRTIFTS